MQVTKMTLWARIKAGIVLSSTYYDFSPSPYS